MIRYYFYLFLNWLARLIPTPFMNRLLGALHRQALNALVNSDERPAAFWIRKRAV